jgi:cell division protein FtsB/cell division protein DivIC
MKMKKKKKKSLLFYTSIIFVVSILLTSHLLIVIYRNYRDSMKMDEKTLELNNQIDVLRETNMKLKKQKHLLENGQYIEKVAREQLGMVKKDEIPLIELNNQYKENSMNYVQNKSVLKNSDTMETFYKNLKDNFKKLFTTISIKQN